MAKYPRIERFLLDAVTCELRDAANGTDTARSWHMAEAIVRELAACATFDEKVMFVELYAAMVDGDQGYGSYQQLLTCSHLSDQDEWRELFDRVKAVTDQIDDDE